MSLTRSPAVAGTFYPSDPDELCATVDAYLDLAHADDEPCPAAADEAFERLAHHRLDTAQERHRAGDGHDADDDPDERHRRAQSMRGELGAALAHELDEQYRGAGQLRPRPRRDSDLVRDSAAGHAYFSSRR